MEQSNWGNQIGASKLGVVAWIEAGVRQWLEIKKVTYLMVVMFLLLVTKLIESDLITK